MDMFMAVYIMSQRALYGKVIYKYLRGRYHLYAFFKLLLWWQDLMARHGWRSQFVEDFDIGWNGG